MEYRLLCTIVVQKNEGIKCGIHPTANRDPESSADRECHQGEMLHYPELFPVDVKGLLLC